VSSFNLGRTRRKAYDIVVYDSTGVIHCKYFRTPYKGYFERFQPQQWVRVVGKVTDYRGRLEFHHPDVRDVEEEDAADQDALIPLYTEIEGVSSARVRKILSQIFETLDPKEVQLAEMFPRWVLERHRLLSRHEALHQLHQPPQQAGPEFGQFKSAAHR